MVHSLFQSNPTCPQDRLEFSEMKVYHIKGDPSKYSLLKVKTKKKELIHIPDEAENNTFCEVKAWLNIDRNRIN